MRHTCARLLAVVAFAGLLSSPASTAPLAANHVDSGGRQQGQPGGTGGPQPLADYKGLTPGEWLAVWWQEVFATSIEAGRHPLITGGAFGGNNGIVFLGGPVVPAGSPKATIRVTIPVGTHLFVPIITVECSVAEAPPFHGEDESELRTCANGLLDEASGLDVKIDGRPVTNPGAYRVETPLFRYGPLTADNALGLPPATQSDAVGAGYALLLPPFSAGGHRIAIRANVAAFGIAVDTEFIITARNDM
jgi:hypothetical protein